MDYLILTHLNLYPSSVVNHREDPELLYFHLLLIYHGLVVPIPTLPFDATLILSVNEPVFSTLLLFQQQMLPLHLWYLLLNYHIYKIFFQHHILHGAISRTSISFKYHTGNNSIYIRIATRASSNIIIISYTYCSINI